MKRGSLLCGGMACVALAALIAGCGGNVSAGSAGSGGSTSQGGATSLGGGTSQGGSAGTSQGGSSAQGGSAGTSQGGGSAQGGSAGSAQGGAGGSCAGKLCGGVCCTGICIIKTQRCVVTLYKGPIRGAGLVVQSGNLYWADNSIMKMPTTGGTPVAIAPGAPVDLAVDATHVYFGTGNAPGYGTLYKVPLAGGLTAKLAGGLSTPMGVAVDAKRLYAYDTINGGDDIVAVPLAGGASSLLASSGTSNIFIHGIAADSSGVYWVEAGALGAGSVMKLAAGGKPTTLSSLPGYAIAIDSKNVYWASSNGSGAIDQIAKSGGPVTTLASGQSAQFMVADGKSVYWGGGNAVGKATVGTPGATQVISDAWQVFGLAVDATSVYLVANAGPGFGYVLKVTPK